MGKKHQNVVRKRDRQSSGSNSQGDGGLRKFKHDYSKDYNDPNWPYAQGKMDR